MDVPLLVKANIRASLKKKTMTHGIIPYAKNNVNQFNLAAIKFSVFKFLKFRH